MRATVIDQKRRTTLPESICHEIGLRPNDQVEWRVEDGEIRGRKLAPQPAKQLFPPGSLLKYITAQRDEEQLAILTGCVPGPENPE
jgi:bifunctional DNA-binding transcriptional regulator/antitoxin component of YhaV-PrlF toxin-antitoxin module